MYHVSNYRNAFLKVGEAGKGSDYGIGDCPEFDFNAPIDFNHHQQRLLLGSRNYR
jgi:hypothetical protein